ncbi:curli production assembly/transport component CsgF [Spongiivirga sp. MCCC 1A20706]|uniref:curli production assembly/transport component CsgF n=1 Tax=Spongiivirga sp. MCCC 1A20706 TaxID=3160963 RepID=UPI003977A0FB
MKLRLAILTVVISLFSFVDISAQQFVYRPVNPAFGGDTFNYNWLLNSANSQNKFKEPEEEREELTELEQFTQDLNRQLLNQLSRQLFQDEFGDESFEEGTFTFGSLFVEIAPGSGGLNIDILDTNTGEKTQIIVPAF